MHELTKYEQFNLVEDAVKTGIAPAEIAAAFQLLLVLYISHEPAAFPNSHRHPRGRTRHAAAAHHGKDSQVARACRGPAVSGASTRDAPRARPPPRRSLHRLSRRNRSEEHTS